MPRYRIAFAREWALGRWGYLDRFFHDLGGRESEPSGLANAWVVDFRGNPRRLGRELAMALNIAEGDFRKYGPIFEIEELADPRPQPAREEESSPDPNAAASADREPPADASESHEPRSGENPSGPTWIHAADVEDATLEADLAEPIGGSPFLAQKDSDSGESQGGDTASGPKTRWEDLFRIRRRTRPIGHHRAEAISGAARRKPPASGSPLE